MREFPKELSQMKQANHRRTNTFRFHLHEAQKVVKSIKTEGRMVVSRGGREGEMRCYCLTSIEFKMEKTRKFWRWMVAMVVQECEHT